MSMATVTVVQAPACHFCADAEEALDELAHEFPIDVESVAADSDSGLALIAAHRPGLFPLVLVDGENFSSGRLPRNKLRALLRARSAPTVRPGGVRP
jgi:glutaredoxin